MSERFHVYFDYDVLHAGRYGRAGTTGLRRATAVIDIPTVRGADLPVAYRVEHRRDMGPGRHPILRHNGQLWWPLVDRTLIVETRDARDFLRELRAGRSDLFVRRSLDDLFLESPRRRRVIHDGHDETLAAVHRNARGLLIIDDGLYVAGGAPLLVDTSDGVHIAGTGVDRAVAAPAGALRINPANGQRGGIDHAICGGQVYVPGYPPDDPMLAEVLASRWTDVDGIAIEILDGEVADLLVVRIDAAFRTAWRAMHRSIPRTRPEGFELLRARFADACGPDGDDDRLTAARYHLLQDFVELFVKAEPKPVAVSDCLRPVWRTISAVKISGRVFDPPPEPPLTEDETAALACLM